MRKILLFFWEITKIVVIAILIVVPIRYFVFQPFFVRGQSMEPSLFQGDYLIVDQLTYRFFSDPQRGEIIIFKYPGHPAQRHIKRIIGLPGETLRIKGGNIYLADTEGVFHLLDESVYLFEETKTPGDLKINLEDREYFVLGDNRFFSADSRRWGPLMEDKIVGRALLRLWPFTAVAKIEAPEYKKIESN